MLDEARLETPAGGAGARRSVPWKSAAWMEVTEEPGALVLGVCGVLDAASGPAIAPYLMAGVVSAPSVTIDLRKVVSCDALGLALVDRAVERGQAAGTRVRVTNLDLGSGSDIGAGGAQRRA